MKCRERDIEIRNERECGTDHELVKQLRRNLEDRESKDTDSME